MLAQGLDNSTDVSFTAGQDDLEDQTVDVLRLALSIAMLATLYADHGERVGAAVWIAGLLLVCYAGAICLCPPASLRNSHRLLHWLDITWAALIAGTMAMDGMNASNSIVFALFLFPVLAISLRKGMREGAWMLAAAVASFVAVNLAWGIPLTPAQTIARVVLLVGLGGTAAYWGGMHFAARHRLALLHAINRMTATHMNVDRTVNTILTVLHEHFDQGTCTLILRDKDGSDFCLRSANGKVPPARQSIGATLAMPFLALPRGKTVTWSMPRLARTGRAFATRNGTWSSCTRSETGAAARIAQLLDAENWISVPIVTLHVYGRLYIGATHGHRYTRADARLLAEVASHACLLLEERERNRHLAAEVASRERRKFSLDLHDSAIQPYIGLAHGLAALRRKAHADHPLTQELDTLMQMTAQVISDLRGYAGSVRNAGNSVRVHLPLPQALQRRAEQARQQYGVDIALDLDDIGELKPELAAQVLQIVSEGVSNICRHSKASHGAIRLRRQNDKLDILIENDSDAGQVHSFTPRSISERAAMLGGSARVRQSVSGATGVMVEIPVY